MGDDVYSKEALREASARDFSIVCMPTDRETTGSRVLLDESGAPIDFVTHKMYLSLREDGGLIFTGLYSMTPEIFGCAPVKMETKDEWALPKTFLQLGAAHPIEIIETESWIQITTPEDLIRAEGML